MSRLLLFSTSKLHGGSYLAYCGDQLRDFLGDARRVLFVPYALKDRDGYAATARARFAQLGYETISAHETEDPAAATADVDAVFVGGGNTFRLLETCYEVGLVAALRTRVAEGLAYMGASAGTNLAGPTIKTTNDMPIVQPRSFDALGLVSFQLNPHYLDPDPSSTHMGETREKRLNEFHEENETPVVALREGAWILVEDGAATLLGEKGGRLFQRDEAPLELEAGAELDELL